MLSAVIGYLIKATLTSSNVASWRDQGRCAVVAIDGERGFAKIV